MKVELPEIRFLNDNVWAERPDCRGGIEDCGSGRVYFYLGPLESLPTGRRKSGELEGPIAGCVIQMLRSRCAGTVLLSGRVAVGFDNGNEGMRLFVAKVWKCVRCVGRLGVQRPDGKIDKNYLVGHFARRDVADGVVTIADRAVGMQYEPAV